VSKASRATNIMASPPEPRKETWILEDAPPRFMRLLEDPGARLLRAFLACARHDGESRTHGGDPVPYLPLPFCRSRPFLDEMGTHGHQFGGSSTGPA